MKLWWPHAEAMIAFLMAYKQTRNDRYLAKFKEVFDYTYKHVGFNNLLFEFSHDILSKHDFKNLDTPIIVLLCSKQVEIYRNFILELNYVHT